METYDVTVIGAGLAGLEVARTLATHQKRVLLIDAKPSLTERVHTTGIFVRRTLEDFHFPEHCLGPIVRDVSLYAPNGKRLDLRSRYDEFRVGKMGKLYEYWLDQCRSLGVTVKLNTRFLSCEVNATETSIHLKSSGHCIELKTRFLIGSDGAQSRVAKSLKLSENRRWIVGLERVYQSQLGPNGSPRFHCLIDPVLAPGYIAWVVDDGQEVHIGVGGNPRQFVPGQALRDFETWSRDQIGIDAGVLIEQRGGRIPVGGLLTNIVNRNGLLVGDAAGAVSPLTAGGLDPCLRLSQIAATLTNEYLNTGQEDVLQQYDGRTIRRRFWKRLLLRRFLEMIRSRSLINFGWYGLDSLAGRAFARKVMFGRGSFPDIQTSVSKSAASPAGLVETNSTVRL